MVSLEEKSSPATTPRIASTAAYYLAFIGLGLAAAILGPTLPGLAEKTQSSLSSISILFTTRFAGYLFGSLKIGRWFDLFPGHRVMAALLGCMIIILALVPVIPTLWILACLLFLLGLAEVTVDVGGNTLLMRVYKQGVDPYMNGLHFFFGLGAFLAPVILAQAIWLSGDITWAYWCIALFSLPVVAWLARIPSPPTQYGVVEERSRLPKGSLVFLVALFYFLHVGAEVSFGGWIYSYAMAVLKLDGGTTAAIQAAYLTSAFWGALTVGRLLAIPISTRVKPEIMLLVDLLGSLASVALILFLAGLGGENTALGTLSTVIWAGTIGTGLFLASIFPTILSLVGARMPVNGQVTGWFFVGAGAGGMCVPWLIGQMFERIGPHTTMLTILTALLLALGVFALLLASTRAKDRELTPSSNQ